MKKLMMGLAMTVLVASPALAQSTMHDGKSQDSKSRAGMSAAHAAYAYAPDSNAYGAAPGVISAYPNSVYVGGEYIGTDPDPAIRLHMLRDSQRTPD